MTDAKEVHSVGAFLWEARERSEAHPTALVSHNARRFDPSAGLRVGKLKALRLLAELQVHHQVHRNCGQVLLQCLIVQLSLR